jgi:hypothetical protein
MEDFSIWCEVTKREIDIAMLMPGEYRHTGDKYFVKRGMLDGYVEQLRYDGDCKDG